MVYDPLASVLTIGTVAVALPLPPRRGSVPEATLTPEAFRTLYVIVPVGAAMVVYGPETVITAEPACPLITGTGCVAGPVTVTAALPSATLAVPLLARNVPLTPA